MTHIKKGRNIQLIDYPMLRVCVFCSAYWDSSNAQSTIVKIYTICSLNSLRWTIDDDRPGTVELRSSIDNHAALKSFLFRLVWKNGTLELNRANKSKEKRVRSSLSNKVSRGHADVASGVMGETHSSVHYALDSTLTPRALPREVIIINSSLLQITTISPVRLGVSESVVGFFPALVD